MKLAMEALAGYNFNFLQFGYNLGKLQELLYSINQYWWEVYEPLIRAKKYNYIINLTRERFSLFKLKLADRDISSME